MKWKRDLFYKRYYKYEGPEGGTFEHEGMFVLPAQHNPAETEKEAHELMYEKAYFITKEVIEEYGGELQEFALEPVSEIEFKRYEKQNKAKVAMMKMRMK